jgi:hypothetical protein
MFLKKNVEREVALNGCHLIIGRNKTKTLRNFTCYKTRTLGKGYGIKWGAIGNLGTNWEQINHLWEPHDVPPKLDFFFFTTSHFDCCKFLKNKNKNTFDPPSKKICSPKRKFLECRL